MLSTNFTTKSRILTLPLTKKLNLTKTLTLQLTLTLKSPLILTQKKKKQMNEKITPRQFDKWKQVY